MYIFPKMLFKIVHEVSRLEYLKYWELIPHRKLSRKYNIFWDFQTLGNFKYY